MINFYRGVITPQTLRYSLWFEDHIVEDKFGWSKTKGDVSVHFDSGAIYELEFIEKCPVVNASLELAEYYSDKSEITVSKAHLTPMMDNLLFECATTSKSINLLIEWNDPSNGLKSVYFIDSVAWFQEEYQYKIKLANFRQILRYAGANFQHKRYYGTDDSDFREQYGAKFVTNTPSTKEALKNVLNTYLWNIDVNPCQNIDTNNYDRPSPNLHGWSLSLSYIDIDVSSIEGKVIPERFVSDSNDYEGIVEDLENISDTKIIFDSEIVNNRVLITARSPVKRNFIISNNSIRDLKVETDHKDADFYVNVGLDSKYYGSGGAYYNETGPYLVARSRLYRPEGDDLTYEDAVNRARREVVDNKPKRTFSGDYVITSDSVFKNEYLNLWKVGDYVTINILDRISLEDRIKSILIVYSENHKTEYVIKLGDE